MKKTRRGPVYLVLALLLFIFFLGVSTEIQSQNASYYGDKFRENRIDELTGKDLEDLEAIGSDLRAYLLRGEEDLLSPHFNSREIAHMEDVYLLFVLLRGLIMATGTTSLLLLLYLVSRERGRVLVGLAKAMGLVLVALGVFVGLVALDFNRAFNLFHEVLFTNDLWIMDPKRDLMIQMLPENFFQDMAVNIALTCLAMMGLVLVLGLVQAGVNKKRREKNGIK